MYLEYDIFLFDRYYPLITEDLLWSTITTLCQRDIICVRERLVCGRQRSFPARKV